MTEQQKRFLTYSGWTAANFTPKSERPPLTVGETYVTPHGKAVMCAQSEYDENGEEPTILISCETGWVFIVYGALVLNDGIQIRWNSATGGHKFGSLPFDHYFEDLFIDGLPWEYEYDEEDYI